MTLLLHRPASPASIDAATRREFIGMLAAGAELEASPLFQRLRPVRDGSFEVIGPADAQTWYFPTALSSPLCLDDIVERLGLRER